MGEPGLPQFPAKDGVLMPVIAIFVEYPDDELIPRFSAGMTYEGGKVVGVTFNPKEWKETEPELTLDDPTDRYLTSAEGKMLQGITVQCEEKDCNGLRCNHMHDHPHEYDDAECFGSCQWPGHRCLCIPCK
jgi:hypothetical protein